LNSFFVIALITMILFGSLMACSTKPAEPDVKSAITLMSHTCNNCYSIVKISQQNGVMAEDRYSVAFSAVIVVKKKAYMVKKKNAPQDASIDLQDIRCLKVSKKDVPLPVGARYEVNGAMHFTESQKDWIPVGLAIEKFSKI
jgi:hypothetical protein